MVELPHHATPHRTPGSDACRPKWEQIRAILKATRPLKKITQGSGKTAEALRASKDELRKLERQQRDLRSFRKLREATREHGEALAAAQERLRQMRGELKRIDAPTEKFQRQFKQTSDEVDRLTGKLGDQRRRLGELRTGLRQGGVGTDNLARSEGQLADRIREANQQFATQRTRMGEVARKQKQMAQAQQRYHRSIGRANNMTGAWFTAAATGGATLYGAGRLLSPGVEYGETMSRVQALTRLDKEDPRFEALKEQSRDLGASTAFSASDVGRGQAFLAMAGFTPESIGQAIPDMLNLALANNTDLGRTADISSNILSGFGLDPDQMGRVADVLTATTTRANVDLEMLGVNAKDAKGDLRDVPQILANVAKATENMGTADRAKYLKQIFGEEPGAGMAELIAQQGAAGIEKFVKMYKDATGESARVASTMADNIGGDLKGLKSAWEEVGISITDTNEGPLRDLIQNVTAITRGIGNWIKANPELAGVLARVAAVLAVVVAVGGALTVMLTSILGPIAAVRYALTLLSLNPASLTIMAIVAAVAALAGVAYLVYRNWGSISEWFVQRWQDVKTAFNGGIGSIAKLLMNWSPFGLIYRAITAALEKLGVEIPDKFKSLGGFIVDGLIGGLTGKLGALKDKVSGIADDVKGWFADKLDIHTPSRVFARLGGYTIDGLNVGLDRQRDEPLKRVAEIAKRVSQAGAGIALGAATLPAAAMPSIDAGEPIHFDTRPPISAPASSSGYADHSTRNYNITINAQPGSDERAIARAVSLELDLRERERAARNRSSMWDQD